MAKKDNWDILKDDAVAVVSQYLKSEGEVDGDTMKKVKVATSVLSSYTRHEQTESAREQTAVVIGRALSDNKEEFAQFLKFMPRFEGVTTKALASG